jgi:aryl-alcohol dehydrogenase-like predicted oxidoreductase
MIYGSIPGVGARVSRLIFGMGRFAPEWFERAGALLDRFVAAGGNAIDTAAVYGEGKSEETLGAWLRRRGRRDDLVIVGKGAHPLLSDQQPRVNPTAIRQDLAASLARVGIEAFDLYLLHRDDPTVPVGPLVECLDQEARAGRIRAYGASNWTTGRIAEANVYADDHGLHRFVASSPQFSLAVPIAPVAPGGVTVAGDSAGLAWYRARDLAVLAWSSQANGWFAAADDGPGAARPNVARVYGGPANAERRRRAREAARRHGVTPNQVALAWLLHQPLNLFALIGPGSESHLEDSLAATALALSPDEIAWLNLES